MGENFHKAGEYDSSINNTNISLLYKDSLLEEKSTTEFAQMQAMYDVHQKDNQIRLLQQEHDINQLRIRRNLALGHRTGRFSFHVLIVGGFFYIRHRNLQPRQPCSWSCVPCVRR